MKFNTIWNKIVQKQNTAKDFGNHNITNALAEIGNPQLEYKTIHVGGTNGKGSTANFIYSYLKSKFKTAIFLSPSVISELEMATVNDQMLSEDEFVEIYLKYKELIKKHKLTFFEIKVFISFVWFKQMNVDYAVIEVGLGGVHDGTNVLNPQACVITNIGDDHKDYLGDTFKSIANNKLGIQKPDIKLFTSEPKLVSESKYPNNIILNKSEFKFNNFPNYQTDNYNIAIQVLEYLGFDKFKVSSVVQNAKLLPFRFQQIESNVYYDGCHNKHGIIAMTKSLDPSKDYVFIFSTLHNKDYKEMIKVIQKHGEVYLTNFELHGNKFSFDAEKTAQEMNCKYIENLKKIEKNPEKTYIFTGSFYFLSLIK